MAPSISPQDGFEDRSELGLARLLHRQFKLYSGAVAIEGGGYALTYSGLNTKALNLVREIHRHQIRSEEPIGILAPRSINHVLAQVAVVYAGGTCVPLDPGHPDQHLENLLRNVDASLVLTDQDHCHRLPTFQHIVVDHKSDADGPVNPMDVASNGPMSCSHLMHTSGTTGKPKAVQVLAGGLINLAFNSWAPVRKGHRFAHVTHIGFDVSLYEIWVALLRGATMVVYPQDVVLDPVVFAQRLLQDKIDVVFQTPALLALTAQTCPQAFSTVEALLTGGEPINVPTIRTIFANGPPKQLFNAYGPTECSVFTATHRVSAEDVEKGHIPLGKPLENYEVFVVDEDLQPVKQGEVGELLVGGVGVAAGYYGDPEKTSKAFVRAPHLPLKSNKGPGHLYRTGDLVRINESGLLDYLGRRDHQVKIRGQRIELEEVEHVLWDTKLVSVAVAMKVQTDESDAGSSILLAYVVPLSTDVNAASITQAYTKLAPHIMVPRIELMDELPINSSGKFDRKKLAAQYLERITRAKSLKGSLDAAMEDNTESYLQKIWLEILGLPLEKLKPTDNFFSIGGTSLQAASLVARIQRSFGVELRAAALYQHPTLDDLSRLIDTLKKGVKWREGTQDKDVLLRDSELGKDLKPIAGQLPDWRSQLEGRVFMTGATGFVGAFLLVELLALPETKTVVCLVRAKDATMARIRVKRTLEKYRLRLGPEEEKKLYVLPGDFSQPDLGLGQEQYDYFAQWASVVFHLGAQVNYVQPYSTHRYANVLGTLHILRFANHKRQKALHYSSSIAAYGPTGFVTGATYLPEDEKPMAHLAALAYDTGYSQSQYVAEVVVWNAVENGLPVAIYRPGFVVGHSKTGIGNPDDFVGRLIASCIRMGCYPLLPKQRKEFIPSTLSSLRCCTLPRRMTTWVTRTTSFSRRPGQPSISKPHSRLSTSSLPPRPCEACRIRSG
ncbi:hypothetical protein VTN96DRAFT_6112 [Rasamsonia emersonii]